MNSEIVVMLIDKITKKGVGADDTINSFWKRQLDTLRIYLSDAQVDGQFDPKVGSILDALGYNEDRLPIGRGNRRYKKTMNIITYATDVLPRQQKRFHASLPGDKSEHLCSLFFLRRKGLLDEYLEFADSQGFVSSMPMVRHWWYYKKIKPLMSSASKRVLEIGAGSGFFASLVMSGIDWHGSYFIVDLPEMLLNSAVNLTSKFPNSVAHLNSAQSTGDPSIHFLETSNIELIESSSIDAALNFNSLMEMQESTRDYYIRQIYRVCKPGAIFYNVNRMQRNMANSDGSLYENNPLRYPYEKSDQIIEWEPDEFQQDYRSRFAYGATESFAISSVRRVLA